MAIVTCKYSEICCLTLSKLCFLIYDIAPRHMLNAYLKFGMCNCSENFMVMSRCNACACVIVVDFSEHFCWYLVNMSFYAINLINAMLLYV